MTLGCRWRHDWKRWAGNCGDFFKKQLVDIWRWAKRVEIYLWTRLVDFWAWPRPVQFVAYRMRCALVRSDGTVSIVKIVSFFPRVEDLTQEVNKRFVPELKKVVSVFGIPMHMSMLHSFLSLHTGVLSGYKLK